jgi:hypothetical protein
MDCTTFPKDPKVSYERAIEAPGGVVSYLLGYLTTISVNITPTNDRQIHQEIKRIWNEALVS